MITKEKELIKYFKTVGIDVHTLTKARGHQGFYIKNRIDISKNISKERLIPTLLHEFAHFVHANIEPQMYKNGGSLEVLFDDNNIEVYADELVKVTNFVDDNSKCEKLLLHKKLIKDKIKGLENIIKKRYPKFLRSKKFKEFDKYIKKSKARYLLKYDRVKLVSGLLFKKVEIFSVDKIEKDFPDMPIEFVAYIRLRSLQKRQTRVSAKINKLGKYYKKPTELFARLIEGLYLNQNMVKTLAPHTYKRFYELLDNGYYDKLPKALEIAYSPSIL